VAASPFLSPERVSEIGRRSLVRPKLQIVYVVIAAFSARLGTIGRFQTIDEVLWMGRSEAFFDALADLDFASMSATTDGLATMPGAPTMWLGSAARVVWALGRSAGAWSAPGNTYPESMAGLALAQLSVAAATSVLIGLIMWILQRWVGPRPALVAGILFATEPFWVAHGSVIHTDELTALFGISGLCALALVLGVPRVEEPWLHRTGLTLLAGALLACSPLTKISGLGYGPGGALIVGWAVVTAIHKRAYGGSIADTLRPFARSAGLATLAAAVTVLALWPAIWADPSTQIDLLRESAGQARTGHLNFFRGEITTTPGPDFYLVALPLRMTPWMLAGVLIGVPVALARRATRIYALLIVLTVVPLAYALSTAAKQFDRYGLLLLGPLCVLVGLAFTEGPQESQLIAARFRIALLGVGLVTTLHALNIAPWGLAYYNPALGGSRTAVDTILVGWQEGMSLAAERIEELVHGECDDVTVFGLNPRLIGTTSCATATGDFESATFVVEYINRVQRRTPDQIETETASRALVATIRIRGIDYATIWQ
jgi:hypothetical protein